MCVFFSLSVSTTSSKGAPCTHMRSAHTQWHQHHFLVTIIYRARWCVGRCRAGERARASPRGGRGRAARRPQVPEGRRPGPERRRAVPALRRAGRPGVQAQHAPHHLDVVVPAGLHVPVEVHDPCALCIAADVPRRGTLQRGEQLVLYSA